MCLEFGYSEVECFSTCISFSLIFVACYRRRYLINREEGTFKKTILISQMFSEQNYLQKDE